MGIPSNSYTRLSSPISGTESASIKADTIHLEAIHHAIEAKDKEKALKIEKTIAQDSQYEPVRAAVRNTDGGEISNKVSWILGLLFTTTELASICF
jgi:hypothetical protein